MCIGEFYLVLGGLSVECITTKNSFRKNAAINIFKSVPFANLLKPVLKLGTRELVSKIQL